MPTAESGAGTTLTVRRTFAASRDRVYRAWTDPTSMQQWFASIGMDDPKVEPDLRPGGAHRVHMQRPDDVVQVARARFG